MEDFETDSRQDRLILELQREIDKLKEDVEYLKNSYASQALSIDCLFKKLDELQKETNSLKMQVIGLVDKFDELRDHIDGKWKTDLLAKMVDSLQLTQNHLIEMMKDVSKSQANLAESVNDNKTKVRIRTFDFWLKLFAGGGLLYFVIEKILSHLLK
ncbi:MAG TPA: hypothetical protein P5539_08940 [Mesotoga sp.]|nr:hypothetical protein [Mesotoga sp.]